MKFHINSSIQDSYIKSININYPTLKLLKSSVFVSVAGALRVYIASILLNVHSSLFTCIAGGLVIYSVYTLDRTLDSEEDIINRKEFSGSRKEIGFAASILTFFIGSYILTQEGMLELALLPFITGFLYSKGIKIGRFALKLKGGLGVKNIVVGITWGICIVGIAGNTCKSIIPTFLVFTFFGIKVLINSVIDDFRDMKGDIEAGIKTIPVFLGEYDTRNFLLTLHLLSHLILGIALINGIIAFYPTIILYSFICGIIYINNYSKRESYNKTERDILIDGEAIIELLLQTGVGLIFV